MYKCAKCGQGYFDQDGAAGCARAGCHRPPAPAEIVPTRPAEESKPSPDAAPAGPRPSLGRIVLYRPKPGECKQFAVPEVDVYPAVVVRIWSDVCVNLFVLTDGMIPMHATSATFDPAGTAPGSWSWPPRV